jgi:hypothetical protein
MIVSMGILYIPSKVLIWLAPQCTENGRHCPSPFAHPVELEFTPHCHALQHPDIDDAGNMQNRSSHFGILELRIEMLLDVA